MSTRLLCPVFVLPLLCLGIPHAVAQKAGKKPDFKLTAEALVKEVIKDEKAAVKKYKGKVVELEGTVQFANKLVSDRAILINGAKRNPKDVVELNVICNSTPARLESAWWFGKGQKIKVVGKLTIANDLGVSLTDCTFTQIKPSPTLKVTAKQLTADFVKDEEAAGKKYLIDALIPKEIIVEGVVGQLMKTKDDLFLVELTGTAAHTVRCVIDQKEWKTLKKGDQVTIKGDCSGFDSKEKYANVISAFVLKKK